VGAAPPLGPRSLTYISGVLPEKARLDAAGAIKVNLRETCILLYYMPSVVWRIPVESEKHRAEWRAAPVWTRREERLGRA
jgi:hypothetical protein